MPQINDIVRPCFNAVTALEEADAVMKCCHTLNDSTLALTSRGQEFSLRLVWASFLARSVLGPYQPCRVPYTSTIVSDFVLPIPKR